MALRNIGRRIPIRPGAWAAAFLATPLMLAAAPILADTVYLKDGSRLSGNVKRQDDQKVVIEIQGGQTTVAASDVSRVEKNDKTSDPHGIGVICAKQHNDDLDRRTGLSSKQRDAVRAAVEPLWSPDEAKRSAARKKLLAMNGEMPVFKYLESYLPYSKDLVAP